MDKLVVTRRGDKVCTAVVSDGKVSQLMLEPDTADSLLGNIYIGKVQKVVSNIRRRAGGAGQQRCCEIKGPGGHGTSVLYGAVLCADCGKDRNRFFRENT